VHLVAHHVGAEVHPGSPRLSAELRQRVRVPEAPMYLDAILVDEPLVAGLSPRLGKAHPAQL
jgi:hypothetical protein